MHCSSCCESWLVYTYARPNKRELLVEMNFKAVGYVIFAALISVSTVKASATSVGDPKLLDPYHATSARGDFTLYVKPSDPKGAGSAIYRLSHNEHTLWDKTLPYTFTKTVVSNKAETVGFSLVEVEGVKYIQITVFNSTGDQVFSWRNEKYFSEKRNAFLEPVLREHFIHDKNRLVYFQLISAGEEGSVWYSLNLDSKVIAKLPSRKIPRKGQNIAFAVDTKTNRSIVFMAESQCDKQWKKVDASGCRSEYMHSHYCLLDDNLDSIACETLAGDLDDRDGLADKLFYKIKARGEAAGFSGELLWITEIKTKQKRSYRIDDGAFAKVGSQRIPEEAYVTRPQEHSKSLLKPIKTLNLPQNLVVDTHLGRVSTFDLGPEGDLVTLTQSNKEVYFNRYNSDRQVITQRKIDLVFEDRIWLNIRNFDKNQWLVLASEFIGAEQSRLYLIDENGTIIQGIPADLPGTNLIEIGQEGIIYLASRRGDYLKAIDLTGKELWKIQERHNDKAGFINTDDIAVAGNGIAVLENIKNVIKVFNRLGVHIKTIDLNVEDRSDSYFTQLVSGSSDEFHVWNSSNGKLGRYDSNGILIDSQSFTTTYGLAPVFRDLQRDKDGNILGGDARQLMQFDKDSELIYSSNQPLGKAQLTGVNGFYVDHQEIIYLYDYFLNKIVKVEGDKAAFLYRLESEKRGGIFERLTGLKRFDNEHFLIKKNRAEYQKVAFDGSVSTITPPVDQALSSTFYLPGLAGPHFWSSNANGIVLTQHNNGQKVEKAITQTNDGFWIPRYIRTSQNSNGWLTVLEKKHAFAISPSGEASKKIPLGSGFSLNAQVADELLYLSSSGEVGMEVFDITTGDRLAGFYFSDTFDNWNSLSMVQINHNLKKIYLYRNEKIYVFDLYSRR